MLVSPPQRDVEAQRRDDEQIGRIFGMANVPKAPDAV